MGKFRATGGMLPKIEIREKELCVISDTERLAFPASRSGAEELGRTLKNRGFRVWLYSVFWNDVEDFRRMIEEAFDKA